MNSVELQAKLKLLYIYSLINMPMELFNINKIVIDNDICSYFELTDFNNDFIETGLVNLIINGNNKFLFITEKGKKDLECFEKDINLRFKNDLKEYIEKFLDKYNREKIITSKVFKEKDEYFLEMQLNDNDVEMIKIKMNVPSKKIGGKMSAIWDKNALEIYKMLLSIFD